MREPDDVDRAEAEAHARQQSREEAESELPYQQVGADRRRPQLQRRGDADPVVQRQDPQRQAEDREEAGLRVRPQRNPREHVRVPGGERARVEQLAHKEAPRVVGRRHVRQQPVHVAGEVVRRETLPRHRAVEHADRRQQLALDERRPQVDEHEQAEQQRRRDRRMAEEIPRRRARAQCLRERAAAGAATSPRRLPPPRPRRLRRLAPPGHARDPPTLGRSMCGLTDQRGKRNRLRCFSVWRKSFFGVLTSVIYRPAG